MRSGCIAMDTETLVSSPLKALQTSLHARYVHSAPNLTSLGSIQPRCNYCVKTIHSYVSNTDHRQVYIYSAEWTGASWRERKCLNFEMAAKGIPEPRFSQLRGRHSTQPWFYRWATALHNNIIRHYNAWATMSYCGILAPSYHLLAADHPPRRVLLSGLAEVIIDQPLGSIIHLSKRISCRHGHTRTTYHH